jgi:curved DNA-binding protein CbpA
MDRTATNHYALMRLPEDATYPAIRARFRALMKLVHPDKIDQTNPAAVKQANDDGQRLNNAYEDLGDDRKRRRYDQKLQDDRAKAEQAAKEAAERERLAAEREKDKKDQRAKEEADRKRKAEAEACADRKRQAKALAKHTFSVYRGDSFLASGGSLSTAHWIASGSVKLVGTSMLSIADIEASLFRILRETYAIDVRSGTRDLTALLFASVVTGRSTYSAPYTAQRMAAIGDVFYIDVQRLLGEFFTTALSKTNATPVLVIFDKVVSAAAPPSRASSDATNGHSTSSSAHATAAGPPPPAPPLSRSITLVFGGRRDCNVFYVGLKTTSSRTSTTSISEYQPAIDVGAGDFYMSDVRRLAASAAASLDKLYSAATHELYRVTGEVVDLNSKTKAKTPFNCRRCVACGSDNDVVPLGEWTYAVIARNIPDQGVSCRGGSVSTPGTLLEEIVRGMTTAVLLGLRQNKVPWWFAQFGLKNTAAPFAGQSLTAFFRTVAQAQPAGCTKDT